MAQLSVKKTIDSPVREKSNGFTRFFKQIDLQLMVIPALILIFIFRGVAYHYSSLSVPIRGIRG